MSRKPQQYSNYECPHDVPWELPCSLCEDEGIEVPQSVLDAAVARDRRERDQCGEDDYL